MPEEPTNLEELLDRFCRAHEDGGHVKVGAIVQEVGTRSFGPLLLLAGVILISPLSGIPGMPTSMGIVVLAISVQMLFRRDHFWLPRWLLKRTVTRSKVERAVRWMQPPARFVDRFLRHRLVVLVTGPGAYLTAIVCTVIALGVPLMEVVPFSASAAGVALSIFGLALVSKDGLLVLIGYVVTGGVAALITVHLV